MAIDLKRVGFFWVHPEKGGSVCVGSISEFSSSVDSGDVGSLNEGVEIKNYDWIHTTHLLVKFSRLVVVSSRKCQGQTNAGAKL